MAPEGGEVREAAFAKQANSAAVQSTSSDILAMQSGHSTASLNSLSDRLEWLCPRPTGHREIAGKFFRPAADARK